MIKKIIDDSNIDENFKKAVSQQMFDEEIKEQINLYKKLQKNIVEFVKLKKKIKSNEDCEGEWRNTKFSYWKDICLRYNEEQLLNCYGDIFFIDEKHNGYYVGRRVLWNLGLSKEQYYIETVADYDADGNYNYTEYEITVKTE